jgi:hypothetical protein
MNTGPQTDELIFDFLEGNLSREEEEALRILKDESELFDREVRLWQNTYLREELPAIESLEQKLLIRSGWNFALWGSRLCMLLLGIFASTSATLHQTNFPKRAEERKITAICSPAAQVHVSPDLAVTVIRKAITKPVTLLSAQVSISDPDPMDIDIVSERKLDSIIEVGKVTLPVISIKKTEKVKPSALSRKKWTRRETRMLRKKRWRENRERAASEFQKGKVPYVVPLDSKNF